MTMMDFGCEDRVLLMELCKVAMEPEASLMVTTLVSPAGRSMNEQLGTVYSMLDTPCSPRTTPPKRARTAREKINRRVTAVGFGTEPVEHRSYFICFM